MLVILAGADLLQKIREMQSFSACSSETNLCASR